MINLKCDKCNRTFKSNIVEMGIRENLKHYGIYIIDLFSRWLRAIEERELKNKKNGLCFSCYVEESGNKKYLDGSYFKNR